MIARSTLARCTLASTLLASVACGGSQAGSSTPPLDFYHSAGHPGDGTGPYNQTHEAPVLEGSTADFAALTPSLTAPYGARVDAGSVVTRAEVSGACDASGECRVMVRAETSALGPATITVTDRNDEVVGTLHIRVRRASTLRWIARPDGRSEFSPLTTTGVTLRVGGQIELYPIPEDGLEQLVYNVGGLKFDMPHDVVEPVRQPSGHSFMLTAKKIGATRVGVGTPSGIQAGIDFTVID